MADYNIFMEEIITTLTKLKNKLSGVSYEEFIADFHLVEDVVRYLNTIGEATKYISDDIKEKYEEIPWESLDSLRDIVNNPEYMKLAWNIVTVELLNIVPSLKNEICN